MAPSLEVKTQCQYHFFQTKDVNIFEALSDGHGRISETNTTSFLSYLLNQTSDVKLAFSSIMLKLLNAKLDNWLFEYLDIEHKTPRQLIDSIEEKYFISCEPEVRVKSEDGDQIIDSILRVSNIDSDKDVLYILIENKIKISARNDEQCLNQFLAVSQSDEFDNDIPIVSLLISPDDNSFQKTLGYVLEVNPKSVWINWVDHKEGSQGIYKTFQELIQNENAASIPSLNLETKLIIKQFNDFIWNEFPSKKVKAKNQTVNGVAILEMVPLIIGGIKQTLCRFENKMIRFLDEEGNVIDTPVKPKLRQLITDNNLEIGLTNERGINKNTQSLGKEIIGRLS